MDRGTKEPNLAEGWGERRAEDAENLVIEHCETGSQVAGFEKNKKKVTGTKFFFFLPFTNVLKRLGRNLCTKRKAETMIEDTDLWGDDLWENVECRFVRLSSF